MAPLLSSLANTIQSLNKDIDVDAGAGSEGVVKTCGTYALINRIINDLASLKTTLKDAEKQMEILLTQELIPQTAPGGTVAPAALLSTTGVSYHGTSLGFASKEVLEVAAAFTTSTTPQALTELRGGHATMADNVGIKLGATYYLTETAILSTLADVYKLVKCLQNGTNIVGTAGTTGTGS